MEPGWELSLSRVMLAAWKRDEKLFRYFCKQYLHIEVRVADPGPHGGALRYFWRLDADPDPITLEKNEKK